MTYHPETKRGEVFLGNCRIGKPSICEQFKIEHRLGLKAYDIEGKTLPDDFKPVFLTEANSARLDGAYQAWLRNGMKGA